MFVCLYTLTNVTNVAIRLDVLHHIMLKVFVMNDFVYLFYFKISLLQIVIINAKYLWN